MDYLKKYPGNPPIYQQLCIPISIDASGVEIGFIRTLVTAHICRVKSGSMGTAGKRGLVELLNSLQEIEHLLKE